MPKPLILFDIDQTLFNTPQFIKVMRQQLAEVLKISPQELEDVIEKYLTDLPHAADFSPNHYLAFMAKKYHADLTKLEAIMYDKTNFGSALFPETLSVLLRLKEEKYPLGLYSEGVLEWQTNKLKANNILEFFEPQHRHILPRKMDRSLLESIPEGTLIIDDKPAIIEFLQEFPQVIPLHIVRDNTKPTGEYTLSSLNDLFAILDSLRDA
jgi:phosphoglycolate phosphatase-like HAD superfamily hydrolase